MAEVTQRELEKIRTDIHNLRDRFGLMLSRAGGHINGQVDLEGWLQLDERAAPSQPATDYGRLYAKSDGLIYWQDDGGTEHDLTSGGGGPGAPSNAQYLVLGLHADLSAERRFVAGTGLSEVDGGANGDYTLSVDATELSHDDLLDVSADDHHNRLHALNSASDHSASGLSVGQVLRATGATTFAWAELQHDDLGGVTADQHHNQAHAITGADHTVTGSQWDLVGLTGTNTLGLLTPSDDPGGTAKILKTNASGILSLVRLDVDTIHDEAGGNLTLLPAGDVILDPDGFDVLPGAGYEVNLGMLSKKYLALHAAELWVETLVAQDTLATIGGRVLVGPTTMLAYDVDTDDVILYFEHNQMVSGDVVLLEAAGKLEFMRVSSSPSGEGPYAYAMIRNLDGTGANQWYAGDAVFNTGAAGDGFIDLYSVHALNVGGNAGPTIVGNVRNSTTYNDWTEHWAIGNLDGLYGYGTDIYGVGLGEYGGEYVTVEATNGIRMYSAGSQRVQIATDGSFWFGDSISTERLAWDPTHGLRIFDAGNDAVITLDTAGNAEIEGDALIDGTVKATKFAVGDAGVFSESDGLLLLGPGCELTATSWKSLRGQEATIANAFQTKAGVFPGTQGIVMEPGTTNFCFNGAMRDDDSDDEADLWTLIDNCTDPVSVDVQAHPNPIMGWLQRFYYTGVAGDVNADTYFYYRTEAATFAEGEDACVSCDIKGAIGGSVTVTLRCRALDVANGSLGVQNQEVTVSAGLQRVYVVYEDLPADTSKIQATLRCSAIDVGDWFNVFFGAVNVEKKNHPTTFCSGNLPWCTWDADEYDSESDRTDTTLGIPVAGNISASTGSLSIRFRLLTQYNSEGNAIALLFNAGNAAGELEAYVTSAGAVRLRINGATRCEYTGPLALDQDHVAVFEWDAGEDDSWLYIDGALEDTDTCGGGAPTLGTSLQFGYSSHFGTSANLCGIVTEIATFDDLLTADEVAANWNLRRPMIDHGAMDSPGVYITDGKFRVSSSYTGTRIEITPEEIAGYNESTKQFWLQAEDGKAYAGGSVVALDENGIEIEASTAFADSRSYKFKDSSGDVVGRVGAVHDEVTDDYRSVDLRTRPHTGLGSIAWVVSESPEGNGCQTNLWATHSLLNYDHEAFISLDTDDSNMSWIWWTIDGMQMGSIKANYTGFVLRGEAEPGDDVRLQADWELTYATSARATKTNIADFAADRVAFMQLKPSTYNAKRKPNGPPMIGLIAEDVDLAFPDLVTRRLPRPLLEERNGRRRPGVPTGTPQISGWDDRQMLVTAISVIQQQEEDILSLQARVVVLETA